MNIRALSKKKYFWPAVAVLVVIAYYGYKKYSTLPALTQYVLGAVERGTLTTGVSGSGQVASSNQVDIKPQVSGKVIRLLAAEGQAAPAGATIALLDATDALKTVRDAEINLESARLSYQKLVQAADPLSLIQAQNSLAQAEESKTGANNDLAKAYDDGFNTLSGAWLDLPVAMTGLHDILFNNTIAVGQWNMSYYADAIAKFDEVKSYQYKNNANDSYASARAAYDKNFDDYKATNRLSDKAVIENLINETYDTTKLLAEAIKSANNFIRLYVDTQTTHNLAQNAAAAANLNDLNTYTTKTNSILTALLNTKNTIQNDKNAIVAADRAIADKTQSLAKLKAGADPLDIQSQNLSLRQRQAALDDARAKLADYVIRTPIAGVLAKLNLKLGDEAGSGATAATIVAKQQIANISLNEVDAAKIKVGQKVTFTFDAIDGLTLTGVVSEIDTLGTVSQGVVTYNVKITFDAQDDRVKPGMSVSADIITNVAQDVLIAPNSAIKMQGARQYVEMLDVPIAGATGQSFTSVADPKQVEVTVGLSNDTESVIIAGLKEGDRIIIKTTVGSAAKPAANTAPSLLPTGGGNRSSGGGFRIGG